MSLLGTTVSHFRVEEKLGGGAMGVVYRAHDEHLDRPVALKFLPTHLADSDEDKERLIREAKAASALDHPNICTVHDIDETEDGLLFLAMAFYDGETLKKRIARGPPPLADTLRIAVQIAEGLAAAHRHGILHRDIKPANVILTTDGQVKIVDFGLAKCSGQATLTSMGATVGTPAYMSPEQSQGQPLDARTDVWSLGVVLYELITGEPPFQGEYHQALVYSLLNREPPTLGSKAEGVPQELEQIVSRALEKDPNERYEDAAGMLADLRALRAGLGLETQTQTKTPPAKRRAPRRGLYWALAVAVVALLSLPLWGPSLPIDWGAAPEIGNVEIRDTEARRFVAQARSYESQGYAPGKLESAEQLYRKALALEPDSALIQASLASLLARIQRRYPEAGRGDEIVELANAALDDEPEHAAAWHSLGVLHLLGGDPASAEASARRALSVAPDYYRSWMLLGETLIDQDRIDDGLEALRRAVTESDGQAPALEALGLGLLNVGRYSDAAAEFERVLDLVPDSPTALNNLATCYLYQGRNLDAVPLLIHLRRLQPDDDTVEMNLGIAYLYLDRPDDAIAAFTRAHHLAPAEPEHMVALGEAEQGSNEAAARGWFEKALEAYDTQLEAGGPRARLLGRRAVCAARLGLFPQALIDLDSAIALAPASADLQFFGAQIHALAGHRDETLRYTETAIAGGRSRQWFLEDPTFRAYWEDPGFRALLEQRVEGP